MPDFVEDRQGLKVKDEVDESGKGFRVFVRGLPFDLTNGQLESHFETIGPVKSCFIVTEKGSAKSKGFGFVGYAMREDAESAVKQLNKKTLLGRRLHVELAKEKGVKPDLEAKRAQRKRKLEKGEEDKAAKRRKVDKKKKKVPSKPKSKALKVAGFQKKSSKLVRRLLKKFGPVDFVLFPSPESTDQKLVAKVWYKNDRSALTAIKKMTNGYEHLEATFLEKPEKHYRLVMRNLSFQCTEKILTKAARKHGEVASVELPMDNDRPKGFAFVQYKSPKVARKAMDEFNKGQLICGRPVAVDWAMGKETYQRMKLHHLRQQTKKEQEEKSAETKEDDEQTGEGKEEQKENEDEGEEKVTDVTPEDGEESKKMEVEDAEETKVEKAEVEEVKTEEVDDSKDPEKPVKEENADDDSGENSSDDEDDSESLSFTEDRGPKKRRDADEGCTVFVRNVPFTATNKDLMKKFKAYGDVAEAFLVLDPVLKRPKGTGFVKFKKKQDVTKLLKQFGFSPTGNRKKNISDQQILLDGRPLMVSLAIPREKVKTLERTNKTDKRNLYLLEEGVVDPESEEAEVLSKQELERRKMSYQTRKKKLQNPNFSISRVRLSVQNLPPEYGDKEVKALFHKTSLAMRKEVKYACRHNMPKIMQAKVIRDKVRKYSDKQSRSRRFGFIQFREHQDALHVLRKLNNTKVDGHRIQIEFALENERVMHVRNQRLKKHQKITKENLTKGEKGNTSKLKGKGKGKKRKRQEQAMDRQKKQKVAKDGKNVKREPLQQKKTKKKKFKKKKKTKT